MTQLGNNNGSGACVRAPARVLCSLSDIPWWMLQFCDIDDERDHEGAKARNGPPQLALQLRR